MIHFSLVEHHGTLYFSRQTSFSEPLWSSQIDFPNKRPLFSSTKKLIQGIFDLHRDLSFFILRNRIYCNDFLTSSDRGMISVVGKRFFENAPIDARILRSISGQHENSPRVTEIGSTQDSFFVSKFSEPNFPIFYREKPLISKQENPLELFKFLNVEQIITFVDELKKQIPTSAKLHGQTRPIVAVVVDDTLKLIEWAVHTGDINKTLHAEVNLIQKLQARNFFEFPRNCKVIISLKPCKMCAGYINDFLPKEFSGNVLYVSDDTGPKSKTTALDGKPWFQKYLK